MFADSLAAIKTLLFIVSADDPAKTQGPFHASCPRRQEPRRGCLSHQGKNDILGIFVVRTSIRCRTTSVVARATIYKRVEPTARAPTLMISACLFFWRESGEELFRGKEH